MMGFHIFMNLYHCKNMGHLASGSSVISLIKEVCDECNLHIVGRPVKFKRGMNVMGIVLLSESHISVHTNGLHSYIDVFCCSGEDAAERAYDLFMSKLEPTTSTRNSCKR